MQQKIRGFYFITDPLLTKKGIVQDAMDAINAGARIIQLRDKKAGREDMLRAARKLKEVAEKNGVLFIVNDNAQVAVESGASGVHLGQQDMGISQARKMMGGKIVGISVSTLKEAIEAEKNGADYLGVGPIFPTSTKSDAARPIGLEGLREIRRAVKVPIIAIGGINSGNARSVIEAGADGICAISATAGDEVGKKVGHFAGLFR